MDLKKNKKDENIDEDARENKSFVVSLTDFIVNIVNISMDIGIVLVGLLFYIYKFIAKHTLLISVIIIGYMCMVN